MYDGEAKLLEWSEKISSIPEVEAAPKLSCVYESPQGPGSGSGVHSPSGHATSSWCSCCARAGFRDQPAESRLLSDLAPGDYPWLS